MPRCSICQFGLCFSCMVLSPWKWSRSAPTSSMKMPTRGPRDESRYAQDHTSPILIVGWGHGSATSCTSSPGPSTSDAPQGGTGAGKVLCRDFPLQGKTVLPPRSSQRAQDSCCWCHFEEKAYGRGSPVNPTRTALEGTRQQMNLLGPTSSSHCQDVQTHFP